MTSLHIFLALLACACAFEASSPLCGCADCNIMWTQQGTMVSAVVMAMDCATFSSSIAPAVKISHGMSCSTLLSEFAGATLKGVQMSDYIVKDQTSCPSGLMVSTSAISTASTSADANGSGATTSQAMPKCRIRGWGQPIDGKYTFAREYRNAVALKNANGVKLYLGSESYDGAHMSSYWVLHDSWGAVDLDASYYIGDYILVHGNGLDQSFTAWTAKNNQYINGKMKCNLHSSLRKINMLKSSPTSFMAWGYMHENEMPTNDDSGAVTRCKSKSHWSKKKCINKCDNGFQCANKCSKKCKACECSGKADRLRLV